MNDKIKQFIKLPNELVWDVGGKRKNTYVYQYNERLCHIWSMFDCLLNRVGTISFSLEQLITVLGDKAEPKKGRNVDQFRNILIELEKKQLITNVKCNLSEVKYKELITCEYSIPILVDKDSKDTQFFQVYREDYLEILDSDTKLNKITLMYIYYYLLSRMSDGKGDTTIYCFPSYEDITKDLDISETTFNTYLNELSKLKLIAYGNIGLIIKNKDKKQANNVYVRHESHLERALDISKNYWSAEGWMVIGKKATKINQSIRGLKGQIQRQKNAGKDTVSLENKLTKLEEKVTNKVDKSLNDIKREIDKLNKAMNNLEDENELKVNIYEDWNNYFSDKGLDAYDIDDCFKVLDYMEDIHKQQLEEIKGKKQLCEIEYDDRGQVILESVLSKEELDKYYREKDEEIEEYYKEVYWGASNPFYEGKKDIEF
ncbi:helix-turn-helix domain-containing protein [Inconstantimicrobium mannanitabidum]|uniref:Uncharacterized protein n=1 Tax=Inconstantimicrobium mannanitabidum TaxID=1604901 RepID=A0ACB5RAC1_9CLOT|nr:helix-turn-helix domain-containing protein [Clostridium sp. TW13]GKX65814.1 hypothetical protein rsdtw13_10720 [Clostridium sp. TW13]